MLDINSGETATVRWLIIVPDFALDDSTLFFRLILDTSIEGQEPQGFELQF